MWVENPTAPFTCLTISTNLGNEALRTVDYWLPSWLFEEMNNDSGELINILFQGSEDSPWPKIGTDKGGRMWKLIHENLTTLGGVVQLMKYRIYPAMSRETYCPPEDSVEGLSTYSAHSGKRSRSSHSVNMCWLG